MITDDEIEKCVHYLTASAPKIAQARADMVKAEAMLRHVKSLAMGASNETTAAAQERWAYASEQYKKAIEDQWEATKRYEELRAYREAASAKIEAWRSMSANLRGIKV